MTTSPSVDRPLLRYYGGKWRLASWIISYFPPHDCYVEPFGGAASVLLRKEPSRFEVYNDLCGDVVNFFHVLRSRPKELLQALKFTPYSREEFNLAYEPCSDDLERARRFFVMAWQGYGGPRKQQLTGWKIQKRKWQSSRVDQVAEWNNAKNVVRAARRFRFVQIESDDALRVIKRFDTPTTFFYCDPPYPADTRNAKWCKRAYNHELSGMDHVHLANLLNRIQGTAIISTYPNELYDDLFREWPREERTAQTMNKTVGTEVLYIHPRLRLTCNPD